MSKKHFPLNFIKGVAQSRNSNTEDAQTAFKEHRVKKCPARIE